MAAKNEYPVKIKSLLLYNDLTWSGVDILRNVEKSRGGGTLENSPSIKFRLYPQIISNNERRVISA
jgi:hypothetical protein